MFVNFSCGNIGDQLYLRAEKNKIKREILTKQQNHRQKVKRGAKNIFI